ncbi:hypothetical protein GCM10011352_00380 [Marinobacterium zhoushanense]|uniref:[NiFe] hydrogenase assembly HybE family chaperone n=1 Tax=Marinobacterium zhoushanense TaxID=1679163 RepID=A0ABQ1JZ61_9GAMM|nr:[NiFe]-hydrogenase assembly chaperone HybE [Marinobacterium zhoushanense]GGB78700.1 hypothetical protein GCM10011352_00380 [Marinobacterium zhoushanense]
MSPLKQGLQQHYRAADARMAGLPFYNALLSVEMAVWHCLDHDLEAGVLITPWCLNLIWRPADARELPDKGETCVLVLPSGEYEGVVAQVEDLGRFASASLLSDTSGLNSQDEARALAMEIADLLFATPAPAAADSHEEQLDNPGRRALFRRAMRG